MVWEPPSGEPRTTVPSSPSLMTRWHWVCSGAYVVCVLEQLHRALNPRDVFAAPSNRWAEPRAAERGAGGGDARGRPGGPVLGRGAGGHLARLTRGLDAAWRQMAVRLEEAGDDAKVEIVVPEAGGRARLPVDKLGAVGEPESLTDEEEED